MKKVLIFVLIISLGLYLGNHVSNSNAEEVSDDEVCAVTIARDGSAEYENYKQFLDQYFKIDTPSSEQIETAMKRYRFFNETIEKIFETASKVKNRDISAAYQDFTKCVKIRDEILERGKMILQAYASNSSASKRTFKLIDAMKALNENMQSVSADFSLTFPNLFEKMADSLPCFAKQCITK